MGHEAKLRKVGGSVMLAIPPVLLDELGLGADASVGLEVKEGRLMVGPKLRTRYSLDQLIAQGNPSRPLRKDRAWSAGKRKGRELI